MSRTVIVLASLCWLVFGSAASHASDPAVTAAFAASDQHSRTSVDHLKWASVLGRHLQIGADGINRFDYGHVGPSDRAVLAAYLDALQSVSPAKLNPAEQHAYWINLYNALTVKVILDHYPVRSIRDIAPGLFSIGPWDIELATVDGHRLTLNNIEHDILRANWRDPRVHYALNCASLGCPNLQPVPYSGALLDQELDAAAKAFVNHLRGASLEDSRLRLSKIYQWYASDFGGTDKAVIAHIRRFAAPELASRLSTVSSVDSYQYDWQLNAPGARLAPR
jgi:hypothetical protein